MYIIGNIPPQKSYFLLMQFSNDFNAIFKLEKSDFFISTYKKIPSPGRDPRDGKISNDYKRGIATLFFLSYSVRHNLPRTTPAGALIPYHNSRMPCRPGEIPYLRKARNASVA